MYEVKQPTEPQPKPVLVEPVVAAEPAPRLVPEEKIFEQKRRRPMSLVRARA